MARDRRRRSGVDVGRGADLEGDTSVANEVREPSEFVALTHPGDVVDDAHAVSQSLGVAELHGLPYRRETKGFAGVDGHVEVLSLHEVKGAQVVRGGESDLGDREGEAAEALIAKGDGELGDDLAQVGLAHRRENGTTDDDAHLAARLL